MVILCATTASNMIFIVTGVGDKLDHTNLSVFGSLYVSKKEENSHSTIRKDELEDSLGSL